MLRFLFLLFLCLTGNQDFSQTYSLNYLKTGNQAPLFIGKSHTGDLINLSEVLKNGKVVLQFYRGAWCPYCNKHMSNLQDSLSLIFEKGATVIAVTPETETSIDKTISKTKSSFPIIHDSAYVIMKPYGVAFELKNSVVTKYRVVGINIAESNGNKDNVIPVPATFILGLDGRIEYIHFDENYKNRMPVKVILNYL